MSRRPSEDHEPQGQDSFLDVVANLVGVLIILVMVVGTQARSALSAAVAAQVAAAQPEQAPQPDVGAALKDVVTTENDILSIQERAQREALEVAMRKHERDRLQMIVSAGEHEINSAKNKLSTDDRAEFEVNSRMTLAFKELA